MPLNREALRRRRELLSISQNDLAIMTGLHPTTISRIERGTAPAGGGNLSIDVCARIAEALQMDYQELIIPPKGNRYQRMAEFAASQHAPMFERRHGRTIKDRGMRKVTQKTVMDEDTRALIEREEGDEYEPHVEIIPQLENPHAIVTKTTPDEDWAFQDPSSE